MNIGIPTTLLFALIAGCAAPMSATPTALNSGLSLEYMNREIRPQDDLYGYANGHWMATTEIPADKSNYGSFTALADKARDDVRAIIEETAAKHGAPGTNEQKVADLYASVMNMEALQALGNQPLKPYLNPLVNKEALARFFGRLRGLGVWGPVGVYVSYDAKDPSRYVPHVTQAGLSLPDRDYYLKDG